ncbi:MAG: hypothetical protein IJX26_02515 [Clostridia bacterium]|nr:hypothetical protein [Clostridia bacterium]
MWEVVLSSSSKNKRIIQYIYKMMKNYVQDKSCILTTHITDKEANILFACAKGKKDYYKEMIKLCVIDYIINVYKYEYLIKNIQNFLQDEVVFKSFIKLLSLYDKQTDELALKKAIDIERSFYIDSFLTFRIAPLIEHWKELCGLAKENFEYFFSTEAYVDIMRFLVATMEENCEKIKIVLNDNKYTLYNINNMSDNAEKIEECSTPFSLISAVLKICPKAIDIYIDKKCDDQAVSFLKNVYIDRVNIIKN